MLPPKSVRTRTSKFAVVKYCPRCKQNKKIDFFYKDNKRKDGRAGWCKDCDNERQRNSEVTKTYKRNYYQNNKKILSEYNKNWREKNRAILQEKSKTYRQKNKVKLYHAKKLKRKTDLNYRLADYLRARMRLAIKSNQKTGSAIKDLGCSIEEFIKYITTKFTEGMTWANYGEWHLDHIKPLAAFDLTDRKQFLQAAHYTNYQPLWAHDNLTKSAKT